MSDRSQIRFMTFVEIGHQQRYQEFEGKSKRIPQGIEPATEFTLMSDDTRNAVWGRANVSARKYSRTSQACSIKQMDDSAFMPAFQWCFEVVAFYRARRPNHSWNAGLTCDFCSNLNRTISRPSRCGLTSCSVPNLATAPTVMESLGT